MIDVNLYLNRIQVKPRRELTLDYLTELHLAHYKNIPYENFDIINQLDFNLDIASLFTKIIINKRGGFCYELNILFYYFLKELGYKTSLIAAQLITFDGTIGPPFDHPLLLVELKEKWLVDVGNSKWFVTPLNIDSSANQLQFGNSYQINKNQDTYFLYQNFEDSLQLQYQFNLNEVLPSNFESICAIKWKTPNSKFTRNYIISNFYDGKRVVLKDELIMFISEGKVTSKNVANKSEFLYFLEHYFGENYRIIVR